MIYWCRINDPLQLFAFLSSFSVSCRARLPQEEELLMLAVSGEELPQQSVAATIPLVPVQRGPVVRLAGLPATRLGWVLLGCGRHSSVTACEHESHLLIFSSAPLFSYSQLGKGGENAFGHWLIYCYITYSITFFQYDRSQSSAALKMPLKFCVNALTEVTNFKKKHEKQARQFKIWVSYFIIFLLGR